MKSNRPVGSGFVISSKHVRVAMEPAVLILPGSNYSKSRKDWRGMTYSLGDLDIIVARITMGLSVRKKRTATLVAGYDLSSIP